MQSFPQLLQTSVDAGTHFAHLGVNLHSFTLAVLAGMVITSMTLEGLRVDVLVRVDARNPAYRSPTDGGPDDQQRGP